MWLNTVRSDHPDLVMECIQQTLTVEWSRALLDAGFNGHIDVVKAALKGGEPRPGHAFSGSKWTWTIFP